MGRFYHDNSRNYIKHIASMILFAALFVLFFFGISNISDQSDKKQSESLETAISRGVAHCYATNGYYPEDLSYLIEHYGILYDSDKYFIDYTVLGENIFPEITIIEK